MSRFFAAADFGEVRGWVLRNARPLELALWRFHFEGGGAGPVVLALEAYQNEDGGFGHAVEPDNWNPESTPYATWYVIGILREIGFFEMDHPMYRGILRYLLDTPYRAEYGWSFNVPSNDRYPHAVWWGYSPVENVLQSIGTTASLSGFILRYGHADTAQYEAALGYADMAAAKLMGGGESFGDMGLGGFTDLVTDLEAAGLDRRFDLPGMRARTSAMLREKMGEIAWTNHMDMSVVIPTPSCFLYAGNEQAVSDALDALIEIRPAGGVWGIPWEWYDGGRYAKEFAISENWWKVKKAIEKLLFLDVYGRLQR